MAIFYCFAKALNIRIKIKKLVFFVNFVKIFFGKRKIKLMMEKLAQCPICNSEKFSPFLECKDWTVSKNSFTIVSCPACKFRFTNPRPLENDLGNYYQSEEYISHSNTKKGVINFLYQTVRNWTLKQKLKLINSLSPKSEIRNPKLLDIGCGTGEFLNVCKQNGWNITGIEPSEKARNFGNENYKLEIKEENQLNELSAETFDIITMWHVLEHVPKLNERIIELKKLIKPSGHIIIAVPNCSSFDAQHYQEYWAAYDVPRHLYHFTPANIEQLFSKHDLKLIEILPMKFDAYYVAMLSEKYKNGKTNFVSALWNGFRSNWLAQRDGKTYSSQIYIFKK